MGWHSCWHIMSAGVETRLNSVRMDRRAVRTPDRYARGSVFLREVLCSLVYTLLWLTLLPITLRICFRHRHGIEIHSDTTACNSAFRLFLKLLLPMNGAKENNILIKCAPMSEMSTAYDGILARLSVNKKNIIKEFFIRRIEINRLSHAETASDSRKQREWNKKKPGRPKN